MNLFIHRRPVLDKDIVLNKAIKMIQIHNEKKNGICIIYHKNGQIKTACDYEDGEAEDRYKEYSEDGQLCRIYMRVDEEKENIYGRIECYHGGKPVVDPSNGHTIGRLFKIYNCINKKIEGVYRELYHYGRFYMVTSYTVKIMENEIEEYYNKNSKELEWYMNSYTYSDTIKDNHKKKEWINGCVNIFEGEYSKNEDSNESKESKDSNESRESKDSCSYSNSDSDSYSDKLIKDKHGKKGWIARICHHSCNYNGKKRCKYYEN